MMYIGDCVKISSDNEQPSHHKIPCFFVCYDTDVSENISTSYFVKSKLKSMKLTEIPQIS